MVKRITSLFMLAVLLVGLVAVANARTKVDATQEARRFLVDAYKFTPAISDKELAGKSLRGSSSTTSLGAFAAPTKSPGYILNSNYRDMMQNSTIGRRVDMNGTGSSLIHFTYTQWPNVDGQVAYLGYQLYQPRLATKWPGGDGVGVTPQLPGEYAVYAQVVAMAAPVDAGPMLTGHFFPDGVSGAAQVRSKNWYGNTGLLFNLWTDKGPDSTTIESISFGATLELIWPKSEYQVVSGTHYTHLIAYQSGSPVQWSPIAYFRKVGTRDAGTYTGMLIDSTYVGVTPTIAASRKSGKVAVAYNYPTAKALTRAGNQLDNETYYRESLDAGATWGTPVNASNYQAKYVVPALDGFRAYAEVSALYNVANDTLHLLWPARVFPNGFYDGTANVGYDCRMHHWSQKYPTVLSTAGTAEWDPDSCLGGAWTMNMAKASLGQCANRFYALWSQYGTYDVVNSKVISDCAKNGDPGSASNGELWISVSNDDGLLWDVPRNITNSATPGCDTVGGNGPCQNDGWATIARYGKDISVDSLGASQVYPDSARLAVVPFRTYAGTKYIDITYVNDQYPGSVIADEGITTLNRMLWIMMPCVDPVPNPILAFTPREWKYPNFVKHGEFKTLAVTLENIGNTALDVTSITVDQNIPLAPAAVSISHSSFLGIAAGVGNTRTLTVTFNPAGVIDNPGTVVRVEGTIDMVSTSPSPLNLQKFEFDFVIADTVIGLKFDTIVTACTRLIVNNNGNGGNGAQGRVNLDFWYFGDCDTVDSIPGSTNRYLGDVSPVLLKKPGATIIPSISFGTINFVEADGFKPVLDSIAPLFLTTKDVSPTKYTRYDVGQMVNKDSTVAVEKSWFAPKAANNGDSCNFMIQRLRIFLYKSAPTQTITLGEVGDWDVPADSGVDNEPGFDAGRNLIFARGYDNLPELVDTLACQFNADRWGGMSLLGWYRQSDYNSIGNCVNDENLAGGWARPFDSVIISGAEQKLDIDSAWFLFRSISGFDLNPDIDDQVLGLNYLQDYSLAPGDTVVIYSAYVSQRQGNQAAFLLSVDKAKEWYRRNLRGGVTFCAAACCTPGNKLRGDVSICGGTCPDGDGVTDGSDLQVYVDLVFFNTYLDMNPDVFTESGPGTCPDIGDLNNDTTVDGGDLGIIVDYVFFGDTSVIVRCDGSPF